MKIRIRWADLAAVVAMGALAAWFIIYLLDNYSL